MASPPTGGRVPADQAALDILCARIAQAQDEIPEPDYPGDSSPWAHQYELARLDGLLLALTTQLGWPEREAPDTWALGYMDAWRDRRSGVSSDFRESDPKQLRGPA